VSFFGAAQQRLEGKNGLATYITPRALARVSYLSLLLENLSWPSAFDHGRFVPLSASILNLSTLPFTAPYPLYSRL